MNRVLFILTSCTIIIALFCKCKSTRVFGKHGESIELITTLGIFRSSIDSPTVKMSQKVWYHDSIGVTEVCSINFVETDTNKVISTPTIGYRYVNLRKNWVYEYANFSDTASLQKKYRYTDTTKFSGGWNFNRHYLLPLNVFEPLTDTIINDIFFKRFKFTSGETQEGICWFRCDKKDTFFQLEKSLINKVGCPPVFVTTYQKKNPKAIFDNEIRFISKSLPDSVQKVFAAWKKNETKYPIH